MPPTYFPLRWESTGDQWWFASPIDWAAANGHYDLVRELLHMDTNLLIKLTSLPRIRRLESVWDDEEKFSEVAKFRAQVAQKLYLERENEARNKGQRNSLIRGGYGGWLLYTAASAGDVVFVKELLDRDPLLVFGEGEYGVTDILYAAARGKNCGVFKLLFDRCASPRGRVREVSSGFRSEMVNRAVHAAARGGNLEALREILGDGGDVLAYRDVWGSTVLHTASGRGQVEVVKHIISSYKIINSVDNRGNTALNVAAFRGHLPVLELLISASPSLASLPNNYGNTFLHMAVSSFLAPGFRRLDRQLNLVKQLVGGKLVNIEDIINIKNNEGQTALHVAVTESIQSIVVDLLMSVRYIDLNIRDADGNTPLDFLKQRPRSASSEILIKRLISAGGISNCEDQTTRNALVSHLRRHGIGGSPGSSFRIPDAEILLYSGVEDAGPASGGSFTSAEHGCSGEIEAESDSSMCKKSASVNNTTKRFKNLLRFQGRKKEGNGNNASDLESDCSDRSCKKGPIPLRLQLSRASSLRNNKRVESLAGDNNAFSESSWSSPVSADRTKGVEHGCGSAAPSPNSDKRKNVSFNLRLMNNYLCFGAQGLDVDNSSSSPEISRV